MPWIVGIDEAGYGPNLGPLVMTAVACRVPDSHVGADLWDAFQEVARRHGDPPDDRFVVADSKLVYSQSRGLADLEQTVQAALSGGAGGKLSDIVDHVAPDCHQDLRGEVWYDGTTPLPAAAEPDVCTRAAELFQDLCKSLKIQWGPVRASVVCTTAFNALLDRWDSKGAVLASSLIRLLRGLPRDEDDVAISIDKHGGRNTYSALLQPAFDGGMVMAREEGSQRSSYEVQDGERRVEVTFEPRADGNHFCVALASMVSKYLRELLMAEFNRFWLAKIPGLKPTAGYPMDAKRFWGDIRPTVLKLALVEDTLWRRK